MIFDIYQEYNFTSCFRFWCIDWTVHLENLSSEKMYTKKLSTLSIQRLEKVQNAATFEKTESAKHIPYMFDKLHSTSLRALVLDSKNI